MEPETTDPCDLIPAIKAKHQAVVSARESQFTHGIQCGELLNVAKIRVQHGEWATWLEANCPEISDRTARLYMKLAGGKGALEQLDREIGNGVANLSVRTAARILSKPRERRVSAAVQEPSTPASAQVSSSGQPLEQASASVPAQPSTQFSSLKLSPEEKEEFGRLIRNAGINTVAEVLKEALEDDDLALLIDELMRVRKSERVVSLPRVVDGAIVSYLKDPEPRRGNPPAVILALVTRLQAA